MHDGRTRRVDSATPMPEHEFLANHSASLTMMTGDAAGQEFPLANARQIVGRSGHTDICLESDSISAEHAAFELGEKGFGVRDLASTNGVRVNGQEVQSQALEHGDRIQLGDCELQYLVEPRERAPKTWDVEAET